MSLGHARENIVHETHFHNISLLTKREKKKIKHALFTSELSVHSDVTHCTIDSYIRAIYIYSSKIDEILMGS